MVDYNKILFISHYSSLYGANKSLLALLDGLDSTRYTPFLFIPSKGDIETELLNKNIPYQVIPYYNWMTTTPHKGLVRMFINILLLPKMVYYTRKWNIQLVYSNSSVIGIGAWLAALLNLPHIWHIREFGIEDYNLKYDFGRKFFEFWLNKSSYIIAVSKAISERVLRDISAPSTVIYNGVISRENVESDSPDTGENVSVFGIIGTLRPSKGQDQAIRAFAQATCNNKNAKLLIAGTGDKECEEELSELVKQLDITDKVSFLGYVQDPFEFYNMVDFVLVCSRNEGMGRVTAEAMISGKVVIGLNNGGTGEIIKDGINGYLYDGSDESLTELMEIVMTLDNLTVSRNAVEYACEHFTIEEYSESVMSVLDNVCKCNNN